MCSTQQNSLQSIAGTNQDIVISVKQTNRIYFTFGTNTSWQSSQHITKLAGSPLFDAATTEPALPPMSNKRIQYHQSNIISSGVNNFKERSVRTSRRIRPPWLGQLIFAIFEMSGLSRQNETPPSGGASRRLDADTLKTPPTQRWLEQFSAVAEPGRSESSPCTPTYTACSAINVLWLSI